MGEKSSPRGVKKLSEELKLTQKNPRGVKSAGKAV